MSSSEARISVTDCPDGPSSSLPALVNLEIDVLLRERGPARAPPDHIAIRCVEERARIEVTMQGRTHDSSLDLGALAPEHRPRAIALAAAELVHSMSNRPIEVPPPKPAATTAAPSARQPLESPPIDDARLTARQRPTLTAGGLVTWLGQPATALFGARVAFRAPVSALLAPAVSVEAATGGFHAESAQVSVTTLSTGAALCFGVTTGSLRWEAGPGARFGWVRLAGEPDTGASFEGDDVAGAWGGLEARARAVYGVSAKRSPSFALELGAGLVTLPVRGTIDGTERVYSVDGPWITIGAEVGIAL
ncbi:MAG TPA: hypothetical protein VGK73_38585 [Polyangiaceae bacterium]